MDLGWTVLEEKQSTVQSKSKSILLQKQKLELKKKSGISAIPDPGSTRQQDEIKAIETSAGVKFIDNSPLKNRKCIL